MPVDPNKPPVAGAVVVTVVPEEDDDCTEGANAEAAVVTVVDPKIDLFGAEDVAKGEGDAEDPADDAVGGTSFVVMVLFAPPIPKTLELEAEEEIPPNTELDAVVVVEPSEGLLCPKTPADADVVVVEETVLFPAPMPKTLEGVDEEKGKVLVLGTETVVFCTLAPNKGNCVDGIADCLGSPLKAKPWLAGVEVPLFAFSSVAVVV